MTFIKENVTRKIDSLGRINIPKGMRDRFEWGTNDELEFAVCYEGDNVWVCMRKVVDVNKAEIIAAELEGVGVEITEKLKKMLENN